MNVLLKLMTVMAMLIVKITMETTLVPANQGLAEMAFLVHVSNQFLFSFPDTGHGQLWLCIIYPYII